MPRICEFYGIVIEMYYADHAPPHFHARYGGDEAKIAIATGDIVAGRLPGRAVRLVREWAEGIVPNWKPTGTGRATTRRRNRSLR